MHAPKMMGQKVIAFDKLDGSNLRFEWNPKRGFYKFGARQQTRTLVDLQFGEAFNHFIKKYQDGIDQVMSSSKYRKYLSCVCFGEYFGQNSEFGQHVEGDPIDVVLFDVHIYKKGLVHPQEFIDDFGHLGIPRIIFQDRLSTEWIDAIKNDTFSYGLKEGVICKTVLQTKKGNDFTEYCKIKTDDWLERLRARYGDKAVEEELKS